MENTNLLTEQEEAKVVAMLEELLAKLDDMLGCFTIVSQGIPKD
jgi:hypothetical protein